MSTEFKATLSIKGQVVIPAEIRRRLGLSQGSVIRFQIAEDCVRLLPAALDVRSLKGRVAARPRPVSLEEIDVTIVEQRARVARR
jgi:AbrB family looped-hinge helix DNA binding protein